MLVGVALVDSTGNILKSKIILSPLNVNIYSTLEITFYANFKLKGRKNTILAKITL